MDTTEMIKVFLEAFIFLFAWIAAITYLIAIAIEQKENQNKDWDKSAFLQNSFSKKFIYSICQPKVKILLKSFFLLATTFFIFKLAVILRWLIIHNSFYDFQWLYTASQMTHKGINPYEVKAFSNYFTGDHKILDAIVFIYPPNILPLIFPLSYFSNSWAAKIFFIINLLSVGFLLWGATNLLYLRTKAYQITCLIACLLIFGVTYSLILGNISTLVATALIWTVIFAKKGKNSMAGFLLGLSTIKPTLAILFWPYFLLKKRFSLLLWSFITSCLLTSIGLLISKNSVSYFLKLYKNSYDLLLKTYYSSPYTSPSRIDADVIGSRLFPNSLLLIKITSILIIAIPTILVIFYLYKQQKKNNWSNKINLSEVSLISCLSILTSYSQPQNAAILVINIVFLLNYLILEIFNKSFSWSKNLVWCSAISCLIIHTNFLYYSFFEILGSPHPMSYIMRITIGSLPNYAILGLTISILILANLSSISLNTQTKRLESDRQL